MSFPFEHQLDHMDCGAACLKIIAKYYKKYYSLPHLRDICGNTREGVSFQDLSYTFIEKRDDDSQGVRHNI